MEEEEAEDKDKDKAKAKAEGVKPEEEAEEEEHINSHTDTLPNNLPHIRERTLNTMLQQEAPQLGEEEDKGGAQRGHRHSSTGVPTEETLVEAEEADTQEARK